MGRNEWNLLHTSSWSISSISVTNYKCLTFTFFRRIICCFHENSVLAKTHHAPCPPHPKTHSASPVGDNTPPRINTYIKHHSQAPTSARTSRDWRKRGGSATKQGKKLSSLADHTQQKRPWQGCKHAAPHFTNLRQERPSRLTGHTSQH